MNKILRNKRGDFRRKLKATCKEYFKGATGPDCTTELGRKRLQDNMKRIVV
jgi:hypothetical protein